MHGQLVVQMRQKKSNEEEVGEVLYVAPVDTETDNSPLQSHSIGCFVKVGEALRRYRSSRSIAAHQKKLWHACRLRKQMTDSLKWVPFREILSSDH